MSESLKEEISNDADRCTLFAFTIIVLFAAAPLSRSQEWTSIQDNHWTSANNRALNLQGRYTLCSVWPWTARCGN
jgi:hypothetical protein